MNKATKGKWAVYVVTLAVALVLGALYWESYTSNLRSQRHVRILQRLGEISALDIRLAHTVDQFRVERFHNFDVLHRLLQGIDAGIEELQSPRLGLYRKDIAGYDFTVDRYARAQMFRYELVEHYMRDVAVLKNSLAYVSNSSSRAGGAQYIDKAMASHDETLSHMLHQLQREVLVVASNHVLGMTGQIQLLMDQIRSQSRTLPSTSALHIDRLLQHSNLVLEYTDIVDSVIAQMQALRPAQALAAVEQSFLTHHQARLRANQILLWFLYPFAGIAILYLVSTLLRVSRLEEDVWRRLNVADETLASMDDAVIVVDRDARVSFANRSAGEITAWLPQESHGCAFSEVVPVDSRVTLLPLQRSVEDCIGSETTVRLSQRLRLENRLGEVHWIKFSASPLFDTDRECNGAVIILRRTRQPSELAAGHKAEGSGVVSERAVFESRLAGVLRRGSSGRLVGALCYLGFPAVDAADFARDPSGRRKLAEQVREQLILRMGRNHETFAEVGNFEYVTLIAGEDNGALIEQGLDIREQLNATQVESGGLLRNFEANVGLMLLYQSEQAPDGLLDAARRAYLAAVEKGERLHLAEA